MERSSQLRHRLHANAQLDLTVNGDTTSGVSYYLVTLIGVENGKRMKTSMLVI